MAPTDRQLRRRVHVQLVCSVIFAVLAVAALVVPLWIEEVTQRSPDGGSGATEALLALPFGLVSVVLGVRSSRTRRRLEQRLVD